MSSSVTNIVWCTINPARHHEFDAIKPRPERSTPDHFRVGLTLSQAHDNTIVRTLMVFDVLQIQQSDAHRAIYALLGLVLLPRALHPIVALINVNFVAGLLETEDPERQSRERITVIGDVSEIHIRVDVVSEGRVSEARESVADGADLHVVR